MSPSRSPLLRDLHPRVAGWFNGLLLLAAALFVAGVFAPMLTTKKLVIFQHKVSLAQALVQLLRGGDYLLFVVIFTFSIAFPIVKLTLLFRVWNGPVRDHGRRARDLDLLAKYGKWSMLDVFVVAVFLVSLKLGPLAQVEVHAAIYAFAASVVLTMYATAKIASYAEATATWRPLPEASVDSRPRVAPVTEPPSTTQDESRESAQEPKEDTRPEFDS